MKKEYGLLALLALIAAFEVMLLGNMYIWDAVTGSPDTGTLLIGIAFNVLGSGVIGGISAFCVTGLLHVKRT